MSWRRDLGLKSHPKDWRRGGSYGLELGLVDRCQYNVTGYSIVSSVWGMILLSASIIKVSIELPVASRHRRDVTGTRTHTF